MKNKQLDTKDLLINKKEELIWRVIDNVINCCAVTRIDGAKSITRPYDDEERYHEREEYGHRERGRYGRY